MPEAEPAFLAAVAGGASGVGVTGGAPEAHFHPGVCAGASSRERICWALGLGAGSSARGRRSSEREKPGMLRLV
jgi:hypothetical protein